MSRRELAHNSGAKNPATLFLDFKSDGHKKPVFAFFDKEKFDGYTEDEVKNFKKQYDESEIDELPWNVKLQLPLKVQFLEHFSTVQGWSDSNGCSIYANSVVYLNTQPFTVKLAKGGKILAEGLYNDIKGVVNGSGGKFSKAIYAIDNQGRTICIIFKGAALASYSAFMDKVNPEQLENRWLVISDFEKKKKGSIKYTTPVFELGDTFTSDEFKLADEQYKEVKKWYVDQASELPKETAPANTEGEPSLEPVTQDDEAGVDF